MIKAILTDIEGTTTSLSFVKDVLFPYSHKHLGEFISVHANEPAVREQLDEVRRLAGRELSNKEVVDQLLRWIEEDKKITPLKALQGMIWEHGYRNGDYKGHVYNDTAPKLREWKQRGLQLYVFSSGSVQAQKLIFGYSEAGDLTSIFGGYFDTNIGNKREPGAYRKISESIGLPSSEILFLSDIKEELDAAREAGMQTIQLMRDGAIDANAVHRQVRNFNEISI